MAITCSILKISKNGLHHRIPWIILHTFRYPCQCFGQKNFGVGFFLKTPPLLPNATALNRQTCHSINRCPKAIGLDYITIYRAQLGKWVCIPDQNTLGYKMRQSSTFQAKWFSSQRGSCKISFSALLGLTHSFFKI